jgi:hypothetical protein
MPEQPALIIDTGDITHLPTPAEFDAAQHHGCGRDGAGLTG